jgi:hypothetical protein
MDRVVADTRECEQCGTSFVPRREHARFCSATCRAAWNREHAGDLAAATSALVWSVTAMTDATQRLSQVAAADQRRGFTVIHEAVWRVTIVDATLVRHHPAAYDSVMAGQAPAQCELVEGILAGLRFVRNRIGGDGDLGEFIEPSASSPRVNEGWITGWTWRPVPEPAPASLPPGRWAWDRARHRGYQEQLAGHTAGETMGRAAAFLKLAAANAQAITDASVQAGHTIRGQTTSGRARPVK